MDNLKLPVFPNEPRAENIIAATLPKGRTITFLTVVVVVWGGGECDIFELSTQFLLPHSAIAKNFKKIYITITIFSQFA